MKSVPNPEYSDCPYELRLIDAKGKVVEEPFNHPRFKESDLPRAVELLKQHDWESLFLLSIAPFKMEDAC